MSQGLHLGLGSSAQVEGGHVLHEEIFLWYLGLDTRRWQSVPKVSLDKIVNHLGRLNYSSVLIYLSCLGQSSTVAEGLLTGFSVLLIIFPLVLGNVHTVPDRFLLRFKSCSGTVWTRINFRLRCRNCSKAFIQFATLPFDLKGWFTKTRFRFNFWLGPFRKPIRYGTFHFQQRSGAVLFRSRNCFESSVLSVNRSVIPYTFCDTPSHCPAQCEHSFTWHCIMYKAWSGLTDPKFQMIVLTSGEHDAS